MINEQIRDREVRLIGTDGEQLGIMSAREAMKLAQEAELDLVKIAPGAKPPVCKIIDYGKYKYEQTRKEKEAKKKQRTVEIKEVRLSPNIDTNDLMLSMRGVPYIDISAAQALMDILRSLHENGVDIVLCGLPSSAMNMMHRSGIYDMVGEHGFYWSVERALLDLRPYTGKK